jgi:hypothetical protein
MENNKLRQASTYESWGKHATHVRVAKQRSEQGEAIQNIGTLSPTTAVGQCSSSDVPIMTIRLVQSFDAVS